VNAPELSTWAEPAAGVGLRQVVAATIEVSGAPAVVRPWRWKVARLIRLMKLLRFSL